MEENKSLEESVSVRSQDDFDEDSPMEVDDIATPDKRKKKALAKSQRVKKGESD